MMRPAAKTQENLLRRRKQTGLNAKKVVRNDKHGKTKKGDATFDPARTLHLRSQVTVSL